MPPQKPGNGLSGAGLLFAVGSYALWGFLPVYFLLLEPAGPVEIVAWRVVLSLVFCALLLTVTRAWKPFAVIAKDRKAVGTLAVASAVIAVNWLVYVFATVNGHVVEAALGYFINPIFTVLLGVFILREKLRPLQWVAIGISGIAVLVLSVSAGVFPWIAILLAASFGFYGFIKKRVGGTVDAVSGLTMETAILAPIALVVLGVMAVNGVLVAGNAGVPHALALSAAGIVTAVPLLLFAAAARRLPLTYMGLTQYIAPVAQFLTGVFILHEPMAPARWIGFGLVWLALILLTIDLFGSPRRSRRALVAPS